jgi:alpha-mannosidase
MKKIHLVCNAHLDPVWLWQWEEGAAEALSSFRTAAEFCERYSGFVFNHNEAILYRWVEEYEPELFSRIQRLVREGRWHIMGGWYLQPDCNMPSGESLVRQILVGRRYFQRMFDRRPTTAINFDPFGHSRGLVQILKKTGFTAYLFGRPFQEDCPLPADDFVWVGYDGSEVIGHRAFAHYLTMRGKAAEKVRNWLKEHPEKDAGLILWGIGDHGGGPSREDMEALENLKKQTKGVEIIHSTPEGYFQELETGSLSRHEKDLNPWAVGCYTSMIRIKQRHRLLENELYMTEKMVSSASLQGLLDYPAAELEEALRDLLFSEFHDILPGSAIQPVEEDALRLMDHGLEIISRLKARSFFALSSGQTRASEGDYPILVEAEKGSPLRRKRSSATCPSIGESGWSFRPSSNPAG